MDSPNPSPAPVPTPEVTPQVYIQPPSPLRKIIKISLISGGIIILILAIILILNYFNILSLSSLFPKYFSFLPHQPLQISPSKEKLSSRAKETLMKSLPKILIPFLLPPSSFDLTQDTGTTKSFSAKWNTPQQPITATFTLAKTGSNLSSLNISFWLSSTSTPSAKLAQTTTTSFFSLTPKGDWNCKEIYGAIYCESFWEEKDGTKQGIGIHGILTSQISEAGMVISFCERRKDNSFYSWQSCTSEFAKTGVR
ncbi:MAG: hypothetical protein PHE48_04740 [Candidatus Daviesbacteria bacterium]|nr:hypothetical protein [Candidatus Daviesbacteria bacterium]